MGKSQEEIAVITQNRAFKLNFWIAIGIVSIKYQVVGTMHCIDRIEFKVGGVTGQQWKATAQADIMSP